MTPGWHKKWIETERPSEAVAVPIVGDAAIATRGIGEGRMIPLVIIDTSERRDIDELIRAHAAGQPGDVTTHWGRKSRRSQSVMLIASWDRPVRCTVILEFDPARLGILVDQTVRSEALYIQPGRPGDRLANTMDSPRLLIEVPAKQFAREWDKIFQKAMVGELRNRGLKRVQAKRAGRKAIHEMRKIGSTRVPR